jgi:hypothetical protein
MSSELTRAIIRGFGGQIGRNLANGSRRRSYSSSPTRSVGRPAQSEFDKALKFDIGGRPSTMVSKVYNLIVEFENKISSEITNCADYDVLVTAYLKTMDKFRDTLSYLEMKGIDVEIQTQFMEMENAVKSLLKEKLTLIVQSLFNNPSLATKYSDSDLETIIKAARSVNVEMNIQATDDETGEVTQIDPLTHLIELVQKERDIKSKSEQSSSNLAVAWIVVIVAFMVVLAI